VELILMFGKTNDRLTKCTLTAGFSLFLHGGDDNDNRVARGGRADRRIPTAVEGVASKMVTVVVFESAGNGFLLFCFDSFLFLTVFGFFFFFFNFGFGL
jgi:hypothetical protein